MASMEVNRAITDEMLKRSFDFYDKVYIKFTYRIVKE